MVFQQNALQVWGAFSSEGDFVLNNCLPENEDAPVRQGKSQCFAPRSGRGAETAASCFARAARALSGANNVLKQKKEK